MANIVLVLSVEDFLTLFEGKALLAQILANTEKIMTVQDDLNNAVSAVAAAVATDAATGTATGLAVQDAIALIQTLKSNPASVSDAQVESAVAALTQSHDAIVANSATLQAAHDALVAVVTPPAGP